METVALGHSGLRVSRLGFGCWQLGGHGWQVEPREIIAAIHLALESGVNFFDTADVYGLGASETLLGEALRNKNAVIATKFGVRRNGEQTFYDNSRQWLHSAVDASLTRLKRDCIDLYQLHRHDGQRPLEDILSDLEGLRAQGKIRWYGISNLDPAALPSQPAGLVSYTLEYSLVQRQWERAIASSRLSFIAWGALAQGLLSGKYTSGHAFAGDDVRSRADSIFAEKNWDYYTPVLAALSAIAEEHKRSMAQTALRFVLDSQPGSIVLAGIKNPAQLQENIGALGWSLNAAQLAALEKISRQPHG